MFGTLLWYHAWTNRTLPFKTMTCFGSWKFRWIAWCLLDAVHRATDLALKFSEVPCIFGPQEVPVGSGFGCFALFWILKSLHWCSSNSSVYSFVRLLLDPFTFLSIVIGSTEQYFDRLVPLSVWFAHRQSSLRCVMLLGKFGLSKLSSESSLKTSPVCSTGSPFHPQCPTLPSQLGSHCKIEHLKATFKLPTAARVPYGPWTASEQQCFSTLGNPIRKSLLCKLPWGHGASPENLHPRHLRKHQRICLLYSRCWIKCPQ